MVSVAIIDIIGLTYDGNTLSKRGLGGSESAVILMSKELSKLGFDVTVINNCIDREATPGVYDGVKYIDHTQITPNHKFDIVISSRTVGPFLPPHLFDQFADLHPERYVHIKQNAKFKAVWMHDTFCRGDHLLEDMVHYGDIDELFTLSDFHTSYVTTCDHGKRRNFEVLKDHIFMTRNGIVKYHDEVDIAAKDPYLYVYNASVTKGMIPLVNNIWHRIKEQVPQAKLKVIGGYYRFRENAAPDEQEKTWRAMVADLKYAKMDIEFTGVIKQSEIADILAKASYMVFPGAFPETFGISTLESLAYNTPLITTRFGALEETAVELACYKIDYAIEPNGLFPTINPQDQETKFVEMAVRASHDKYLHQQKMYYCNAVKDICTWDTVALQWKQHLFKKLGLYLSKNEYQKVSQINSRVHEVFGRRFSNPEEVYLPRKAQQRIVVITPMYNAAPYIQRCITSVITQDYDNWKMYIIDDKSTDNSVDVAEKYTSEKVELITNTSNMGAVYNQVSTIVEHCEPDDIVMLLDGDDALTNDNQIFQFYNNLYDGTTEFTYGSCWSMADNIPLVAQHYPKAVRESKTYRSHRFNWNMPYTHLRTFTAGLINGIDEDMFKDENGNWFKAGGDGSLFYALIENADPAKVKAVTDIVYVYNDLNPLNDYKINGDEQTKNANAILKQKQGPSKANKFSVIIPTMWRAPDVFRNLLERLVEHELVGEIIIINNDTAATPMWMKIANIEKLRTLYQYENIKVNPAWNLGVEKAEYPLLCIVNDDIVFDTKLFDKIQSRITPEAGVYGMVTGEEQFNHPKSTDYSIDFKQWEPGDNIHGFGQLMFMHKDNWLPIIDGLEFYYGDDYIFHSQLMEGRKNYIIYNLKFESVFAATTSDGTLTAGAHDREFPIWAEWFHAHPLPVQAESVIEETKTTSMEAPKPVKTILIAIPTNRYIEPETMKSVYDQEVPEGYKTFFQYFYGYQIDQIRNLIADWAKHYDYLFAVDSDVSFAPDTLKKLLSHNVDVVSGLYIQRKPGQHILEIYKNGRNVPYEELYGKGLVEVDSCGFGCVLVNSNVIRTMEYPHFLYKSAIDHANTVSEDTYFCFKAKGHGFRVWADTSIACKHHGQTVFELPELISKPAPQPVEQPVVNQDVERLRELGNQRLLPTTHVNYLQHMKESGVNPRVIYDIGACVLHWTREAKNIWPGAEFIAFEAMKESKPIFDENGVKSFIGVLSDTDGKELTFYQNTFHPGGNSYYKENQEVNREADLFFNESHARKVTSFTLDSVVYANGFPAPDLIKMDVQGAELDIIKGASRTLASCKDLILELQKIEYNKGAPLRDEVIAYLQTIGFTLVTGPFSDNGPDGDYHFRRV